MDDDRQIEALSDHVLANLTVEELEQRLELQMLQGPMECLINWCGVDGCSDFCGARCDAACGCRDTFVPCGVEGCVGYQIP